MFENHDHCDNKYHRNTGFCNRRGFRMTYYVFGWHDNFDNRFNGNNSICAYSDEVFFIWESDDDVKNYSNYINTVRYVVFRCLYYIRSMFVINIVISYQLFKNDLLYIYSKVNFSNITIIFNNDNKYNFFFLFL